jgi:hypothetical protein
MRVLLGVTFAVAAAILFAVSYLIMLTLEARRDALRARGR